MAAIVPALAVRLLLAHRDPSRSRPDLVGKRIGGVQGDQIRIDAMFTVNGLEPDYEFVPMSFDPQPLVDGEMDVITAYVTNQPIRAMQGQTSRRVTFSDFGLTVVRRRDLRVPEVARRQPRTSPCRYFRGLIAGADALVADPDSMIPIMMENCTVPTPSSTRSSRPRPTWSTSS